MTTVDPGNAPVSNNVTEKSTDARSNVTIITRRTPGVTETTGNSPSTKVTENQTKMVNGTTTGKTTTTRRTTTTMSSVRTVTPLTRTTIKIQNKTTSKVITTKAPSYSTTKGVVTDVTFSKMSHPVTSKTSATKNVTSPYVSTIFPITDVTSNVTASNTMASTVVDGSVGVQKMNNDCMPTIAIVAGVCAGLVLVNLLVSILCFCRLRHKWRAKIQLERKKTDIWSMATYNNTIINENFSDYQLASETNKKNRKTSKFSDDSIQFFDPFADTMSQSRFAPNHDDIAMRNVTLPPEARADFSTLRRNTVSAPEELDSKLQMLRIEPDNFGFSDDRNTLRGRSSTFTVGRKNNVDRHVLLSHEELVDDQSAIDIGQPGPRYNVRTNSYHITEL